MVSGRKVADKPDVRTATLCTAAVPPACCTGRWQLFSGMLFSGVLTRDGHPVLCSAHCHAPNCGHASCLLRRHTTHLQLPALLQMQEARHKAGGWKVPGEPDVRTATL